MLIYFKGTIIGHESLHVTVQCDYEDAYCITDFEDIKFISSFVLMLCGASVTRILVL